MEIRDRIRKAVETTRRLVPGYFEKTLEQRSSFSEKAGGSVYDLHPEMLEAMLLAAPWENYSHPVVSPECTAYKAPFAPGRLGVEDLRSLPSDAVVTLDDRKNTGKVSAVVKGVRGREEYFTVLILGLEQGEEVIFTFHPGDPVRPSQVQVEPGMHGRQVAVAGALAVGLETAKIE